ncbi:MAG TPA: DUF1524 domain-containing protein [Acidimicrobiales bacterium]|nr:DUF1524 domain-containing protein [Acidimicrobiales bacterium]
MVGATEGFNEAGESTGGHAVLQIPPTRPPRRRPRWSRGTRTAAIVAAVVVTALTASSLVDKEVNKRLATVPLVTTTTSPITTSTVVAPPPTPRNRHDKPVAVTVVAQEVTTTTTTTTMVMNPEVAQSAYDIITKLDKLPVRDERSFGYTRYRFGLWTDEDGDGCTKRDDVVILQAVQVVRGSACEIVSGRWVSPYDNATIQNPDLVDVDHVVALLEAWESGAYKWTDAQRNAYKNDIADFAVLAVSDESADDKDDRDPADWLPSNDEFVCRYLQTWVDVKTKWNLAVNASERESIAAAALNC